MEIIIPLIKGCFWPFLLVFVIFPALTFGCLCIIFRPLKKNYEITKGIINCDGYLILRVKQISLLYGKTNIPYHVNEFWICKFNAKPIDYSRNAF